MPRAKTRMLRCGAWIVSPCHGTGPGLMVLNEYSRSRLLVPARPKPRKCGSTWRWRGSSGMVEDAGRVGLPDLDHRVLDGGPAAVEDVAVDDDALAPGPVVHQDVLVATDQPEREERADRLAGRLPAHGAHAFRPSKGVMRLPERTMSKR